MITVHFTLSLKAPLVWWHHALEVSGGPKHAREDLQWSAVSVSMSRVAFSQLGPV